MKVFLFVVVLAVSFQSHSALPPEIRNQMDLEVMLGYANKNYEVITQLQSISLKDFTIYYGENCKVKFQRKTRKKNSPLVGAATDLVVKEKICSRI